MGRPDAEVVIVVATDYACPHCARAFLDLREAIQARPWLSVHAVPFPLASACNPVLDGVFGAEPDPIRCRLQRLALCAHGQGKWEAAAALIFEDPSEGAFGAVRRLAGVRGGQLDACVADPAIHAEIAAGAARAAPRGETIEGVPTMWVYHGGLRVRVGAGVGDALQVADRFHAGADVAEPR